MILCSVWGAAEPVVANSGVERVIALAIEATIKNLDLFTVYLRVDDLLRAGSDYYVYVIKSIIIIDLETIITKLIINLITLTCDRSHMDHRPVIIDLLSFMFSESGTPTHDMVRARGAVFAKVFC